MACDALARRAQVTATAAVVTGIFALVHAWRRWRPKAARGAPHVPGHWLLGSWELLQRVIQRRHLDQFLAWHEEYGDTFCFWLPGSEVVVTRDPVNIEHVLKTQFDRYPKGEWMRKRLHDLLGDGIFNADGALWHKQRKTASHMFTHNQFKNHIWTVVDRNCRKVAKILREQQPGAPALDMFNLMNRFTLDTIGEVGFGTSIGSLENPASPFLNSFDQAQQICMWRFIFPHWQINRFFGLGFEKHSAYHIKLLRDYSREVTKKLRDGEGSEDQKSSFVGLFLADAKKKGEDCDEKVTVDLVLNFLIAGRDTTAQALSWCLYCVAGHPAVEQKLLVEAKDVLGDGDLTYDNLNRLTYSQAVLSEALRLHPSVPLDDKLALEDDTWPDGTFVPKGSIIRYNPYGAGRSRQIWGEDALEFRPERWLDSEPVSPYAYPVFNAGPRECLGKRLAMLEMKACLVTVLRAVKLELAVPREAIHYDTQLTLGMSSGLPCRVQAR